MKLDERFAANFSEDDEELDMANSSGSSIHDDEMHDESELENVDNLLDDGNSKILSIENKGPLTLEKLKLHNSKIAKTGVVYLSSIPPFMKPIKVRQLLLKFGELGRLYLAPEDAKITKRRIKYRGNKRQQYVEGWVEFMDKSIAKSVASMLNGNCIGGKKRSFYHDDIWNIKYLSGFKWDHLTEQIAYELAVKDQKVKQESMAAKRENKLYLKNVGKAKMIEAIKEKKGDVSKKTNAILRSFKQRKIVEQGRSEVSSSILNKIF